MKRNSLIILSILLLITLNFCSKNKHILPQEEITPDNHPYPMVFSIGKTIELDIITKGRMFFESNIDIPGYIYCGFLNASGDREIWQFNEDLQIKSKYTIKYGQGPGEALNLRILGVDKQEIIGYDLLSNRLLFWDRNFSECRMKKEIIWSSEKYPGSFAYSPITGSVLALEAKIHGSDIFKPDLELTFRKLNGRDKSICLHKVEKWKTMEERIDGKIHSWLSIPLHSIIYRDYVFVVNLKDYHLFKYTLDGKLLRTIRVVFPQKTFSSTQLKKWVKAELPRLKLEYLSRKHLQETLWPACWILPLGDGIAVGRRDDYGPSGTKWINCDYFDMNLHYQGRIKIPAFEKWNSGLFSQSNVKYRMLSRSNNLYIINNDETTEKEIITQWTWKDEK